MNHDLQPRSADLVPTTPSMTDEPPGGIPIVVNGRARSAPRETLDRAELFALAFPWITTATERSLTITYRRGPAERPQGFVIPGERVRVVEGEVFVVVLADRS